MAKKIDVTIYTLCDPEMVFRENPGQTENTFQSKLRTIPWQNANIFQSVQSAAPYDGVPYPKCPVKGSSKGNHRAGGIYSLSSKFSDFVYSTLKCRYRITIVRLH